MNINEIFYSIQGEGIHMGKSATFIRFAGCNLDCFFCDSSQATEVKRVLEPIEVVALTDFSLNMIILTGGEPTTHDLKEFLSILNLKILRSGLRRIVAIETNGTNPTMELDVDWVTVSPKPSNMYQIHSECVPSELKYVVTEDLKISDIAFNKVPPGHIWLQPESCKPESIKKAIQMCKEDSRLRVGIQMHKYYEVE